MGNIDGSTLRMIEETAEKVAERTGAVISANVRADLAEFKGEIKEDVKDIVDERLRIHLGDMTAHEHTLQHYRMQKITNFFDSFSKGTAQKLGGGTLVISIIASLLYTASSLFFNDSNILSFLAQKPVEQKIYTQQESSSNE